MAFLEQLTPHQRQTVVRLPYRVGLWVSRSDSSGGTQADENELRALSSILHAFAEDLFGAETVQYIISATIREKADWPQWGENLDSVAEECRIAIDLVRQYADDKDAKAFRMHLMEIAEAVALAFREDERSVFSMFGLYVCYMLEGTKRGARRKSFEEFLSISHNERKTLKAIESALEAA